MSYSKHFGGTNGVDLRHASDQPTEYHTMYLSTVTGNDDSRLNRRLQPRRDDDPLYVSKFQTRDVTGVVEAEARVPVHFSATRKDVTGSLAKQFTEDPQQGPATRIPKEDRRVGLAYEWHLTRVAEKVPYSQLPAPQPSPVPPDFPSQPVFTEPWAKYNPDFYRQRAAPVRSVGLDVTDIPGATARLPKEVTVRDPLDYRDVPLSFSGSRQPRVRPEFRDHLSVRDINAKPLPQEREPFPPVAEARPTVHVLTRQRGPTDLSLTTGDVGAVPRNPHDAAMPMRGPRWMRNPADSADIEGAQPRLKLPLQERHARKLAQAEERAQALEEGRRAAAEVRLPQSTVASLLAGMARVDRDSCGIVSAFDARKALRVGLGADAAATAERALAGFTDNVGNIKYRELHDALARVAVPDPEPAPRAADEAPRPAPQAAREAIQGDAEAAAVTAPAQAEAHEDAGRQGDDGGAGPVGSLVEWEAGHEDGGLGAAGGVSRGRKWVPERANPRPKRQVLANNPGRRGVQGATTGLIGTASAYIPTTERTGLSPPSPAAASHPASPVEARRSGSPTAQPRRTPPGPRTLFASGGATLPVAHAFLPSGSAASRAPGSPAARGAPSPSQRGGATGEWGTARLSVVTGRPLQLVPASKAEPEMGVSKRRAREALQEELNTIADLPL